MTNDNSDDELDIQAVAQSLATQDEWSRIENDYVDGRDQLNQMIGQVQTLDMLSKVLHVSSLLKLQHIKENKLYKRLRGQTFISPATGEVLTVSTWADFCTAIGRSRQHVDEQLLNLKVLGQEALEGLQKLGVEHRELRKLRQLPDADRDVVIQEVNLNTGDKEAIVDLIDDMASKHAAEKASLEKQLADALADGEAKDRINADKNDKLDELSTANHKLINRSEPWPVRVMQIASQVDEQGALILQALARLDQLRDAIQNEPFETGGEEEAFDMLGRVYYDAIARVLEQTAQTADLCDQVFIALKDQSIPLESLWLQLRERHPDLFGDQEAGQ